MTEHALPPDQAWPSERPESALAMLDFWLRSPETGRIDEPQSALWFSGGERVDADITARFEALIGPASRGELAGWDSTASGRLALIILLDQFPRNCYRGTARAFAYADAALLVCESSLQHSDHAQLPITGQVFLAMPLEHDEAMASQDRSVEFYSALLARAPEPLRTFAQGTLDYAIEHRDIVQRFGRFPHRNEVLGRDSTEQEREWLAESGKRFGQ